MLNFLQLLLVRVAMARYIIGMLGSLAVALPLAWLLETIGIPLLVVLGIIAVPVLAVLLLVGLPLFVVLLGGAAITGIVSLVMAMGVVVLKFLFLVVLPLVVLAWLVLRIRRGVSTRGTAAHSSASATGGA